MKTSEVLKQLRVTHGLTQDQMAERVLVTRQAVTAAGRPEKPSPIRKH